MRLFTKDHIKKWFLSYLFIQLFLSLLSIPVLSAWNIPFSCLSLVGNLIFVPIFMLYLTSSTILFFTELFGLPNNFFVSLIELITYYWHCVANMSTDFFTLRLSPLPVLINLIIYLFIFLILLLPSSFIRKTVKFSLLFLAVLLMCSFFAYKNERAFIKTISCGKKSVFLLHLKKKSIILDSKALGSYRNYNFWLNYKLKNFLFRSTGSNKIDTWILFNPSKTTESKSRIGAENYATQISKLSKKAEYTNLVNSKLDQLLLDFIYK